MASAFDSAGNVRTLGKHARAFGEDEPLFSLPYEAKPDFKKLYSRIVCGTAGAARFFADVVTDFTTTSFINGIKVVWTFSEEDPAKLWRPLNIDALELDALDYLIATLSTLKAYVDEEAGDALSAAIDEEGSLAKARAQPGVKAWLNCQARVVKMAETLTSETGRRAVSGEVFKLLRDDTFPSKLNAKRDCLPFENGQLLLKARPLELRQRTKEDFVTYTLPYAWDSGADSSFMTRFVRNLYVDDAGVFDLEAEKALQTTVGYCATGEVMCKAFWTIIAPKNAGKTSLLVALQNALGDFAVSSVAITDLLEGSNFEHDLAAALAAPLPPRLVVFDEINTAKTVKQDILNTLTSGNEVNSLRSRQKGKGSAPAPNFQAKLWFAGNNKLLMPPGADGTIFRCHGFGLTRTFDLLDGGVPLPGVSAPDPALIAHIESKETAARQGIMRWIVEGAVLFYDAVAERGRAVWYAELSCPRFDADSFKLQLGSSEYMSWLAEACTPTGRSTERVSLDSLVAKYGDDRKVRALHHAQAAIKLVLDTCRPYVRPTRWVEYGTEVEGYVGMQFRRAGDADWALPATRVAALAAYRAELDM